MLLTREILEFIPASERLWQESNGLPPVHVAIIMDGNGRWALSRGLSRTAGHIRGIRTARRVVREAKSLGVKYLSLFAFSTENWKRSAQEVSIIMYLLERYLKREAKILAREGIRLRVIGDRARLPKSLQQAIQYAEENTGNESEMILTLAISYSGQDEIVKAASSLAEACCKGEMKPSLITRETFSQHLSLPSLPPVDLLVRTGGEQRISNFLLWSLAYAELIFYPNYWPDFRGQDLSVCIGEFKKRQRRFGKEQAQPSAA